jgi:ABC-type multidrug transport system fused ATPase/permease subunit
MLSGMPTDIIVLEKGDVVGNGTHDELYATCPIYRGICDSQISSKER